MQVHCNCKASWGHGTFGGEIHEAYRHAVLPTMLAARPFRRCRRPWRSPAVIHVALHLHRVAHVYGQSLRGSSRASRSESRTCIIKRQARVEGPPPARASSPKVPPKTSTWLSRCPMLALPCRSQAIRDAHRSASSIGASAPPFSTRAHSRPKRQLAAQASQHSLPDHPTASIASLPYL